MAAGDQYGYISARLTVPARDALAAASIEATGLVRKRVSQSTALLAALKVAQAHPDELRSAITELQGESQ